MRTISSSRCLSLSLGVLWMWTSATVLALTTASTANYGPIFQNDEVDVVISVDCPRLEMLDVRVGWRPSIVQYVGGSLATGVMAHYSSTEGPYTLSGTPDMEYIMFSVPSSDPEAPAGWVDAGPGELFHFRLRGIAAGQSVLSVEVVNAKRRIGDTEQDGKQAVPGGVDVWKEVAPVQFSPNGGLFNYVQTVTLTADYSSEIYYTLNGEVPDKLSPSSTRYAGPFEVLGADGESVLVRAIAYGLESSSSTGEAAFSYDFTPPGVSISGPSPTLSNQGPVSFTVTYADAWSIALVPEQIVLVGSPRGVVGVTPTSPTTRVVTVSQITGDGSLAIRVLAGSGFDKAGNPTLAAGPSLPVTVDNTPPGPPEVTPPATPTRNRRPLWRWTAGDGDGTGVFRYKLDDADLSQDATITLTPTFSPTMDLAEGFHTLYVQERDAIGNWSGSGFGVVEIDRTPPAIGFLPPSTALTNTGPVSLMVTYTGASQVTLSDFDVTVLSTGTATGTVTVSGGGSAARTVTLSEIRGNGTLAVSLAAGTATDAAGNVAGAAGPSASFTVDNTPPNAPLMDAVVSPTRNQRPAWNWTSGSGGGNGTFRYRLDNPDLTAAATETTDNGLVPAVDIPEGLHTLYVQERDAAGNWSASASRSVVIDVTPPSIVLSGPSVGLTNSGPVVYTVTYADATSVTLTAAAIALVRTGTADGTLEVTGAGTATRTITVSGTTGNGTLAVSLAAGTAVDAAGNLAQAAGPSPAFTVDNTAPDITISAPSATLTRAGPVTYTVTYTDASAVSLNTGDVTLTATGTATGTVSVGGSGLIRTVTISAVAGDGAMRISLAAGTATDAAGNTAAACGPSATFTADNTAPGVVIGAPSSPVTQAGPVTFSVAYTGASVITLAAGDVTLNATGTATGTVSVGGSGLERTVTISEIAGDGRLRIPLAAGEASDAAGDTTAAAGAGLTLTADNTPPGVAISAPSAALTRAGPVTFTVTYTDALAVALAAGDVTLNATGTATGTVSVSGSGFTRTVTISEVAGDGRLGISLAAGTAVDAAGNLAAAAGPSVTFTARNTAPSSPVVTGASPTDSLTPTWSWASSGPWDGEFRYKLDDPDLSNGATVTSGTQFTPFTPLSEGMHTLYVQESDDIGNWSGNGSFTIEVLWTVELTLVPGWNMISFPGPVLADHLLVFRGQIAGGLGYAWLRDRYTITADFDETSGFWVYRNGTAPATLTLRGHLDPNPQVLSAGWNLARLRHDTLVRDFPTAIVRPVWEFADRVYVALSNATALPARRGTGYWVQCNVEGAVAAW